MKEELGGAELWRRQCARNLMDCYALGMEALAARPAHGPLQALTRMMVDGMTAVRTAEDERAFYKTATALCRECAGAAGEKAALFRIYAAVFGELGGRAD